jgi:tetratricopeptide (TPR) repeat protein
MRRLGAIVGFLFAFAAVGLAREERDELTRARTLYNQRQFEAAIASAEQARQVPARADSADLIAARAYLELYRERAQAEDLERARERLRRLDPQRFGAHERVEYIVGLGETLYFDGSFGAAAGVFDSVLEGPTSLTPEEHERVLDWWASALDRDARPRTEFDRQAVYQRIRERMQSELSMVPTSAAASYWISMAARGHGDLQGAWEAVQAGWVRAPMAGDRAPALRADLDRLVLTALVPERARALGQPPETLREEWERFKSRWARE